MLFDLDTSTALAWTIRLICLGTLIDGLQKLVAWRWLPEHASVALREPNDRPVGPRERLQTVLLGTPTLRGIWLARTLLAAGLLHAPMHPWLTALAFPLLFLSSAQYITRTFPFATTGADRMMAMVFGALCLWRLDWCDEDVGRAALLFLALQACLSYATAGWSRRHLPSWRNGTAVGQLWALPQAGTPPALGRWITARPWMNRALTWGTLAVECSFPLALLGPPWLCAAYLAWGVSFHLSNALVMGLNGFLWAWLALYPAIIWFHST